MFQPAWIEPDQLPLQQEYEFEINQLRTERDVNPFFPEPKEQANYRFVSVEDAYLKLAAADDVEQIRQAIEQGKITVDYFDARQYGYRDTLLHAAVWGRAQNMINYLHRRGVNPNKKNRKGYSPWHVAITLDDPQILMLLTQWTNLDKNERTFDGRGPLHLAIDLQADNSIRFLALNGVDKSLQDFKGVTALDYAQKRNILAYELRKMIIP